MKGHGINILTYFLKDSSQSLAFAPKKRQTEFRPIFDVERHKLKLKNEIKTPKSPQPYR